MESPSLVYVAGKSRYLLVDGFGTKTPVQMQFGSFTLPVLLNSLPCNHHFIGSFEGIDKRAINCCDAVFAYLDMMNDDVALEEIRYAASLPRCTMVCFLNGVQRHYGPLLPRNISRDLVEENFPLDRYLADFVASIEDVDDDEGNDEDDDDCESHAQSTFFELSAKCQSPIEKTFFRMAYPLIPDLTPQYVIGPYKLDFAVPLLRVCIETDGHDYHKTKEQRTHDAKRQRWLEARSWRLIRFTGSEIHRDAIKCAKEAAAFVERIVNP